MERENKIEDFNTLPPSDLDSEMCAIASFILAADDPAIRVEILAILRPEDFYQPDNQIIFRAIVEMDRDKESIDAVTLRSKLIRQGIFEEVGGIAYLGQILATVPTPRHGPQYARSVKDRAILRQIIQAAESAKRAAYAPAKGNNATEIAQRALKRMGDVISGGSGFNIDRIDAVMAEVREQTKAGGVPGVMTGFHDLDAIGGGIGYGEMCVVAGRPSMGKSLLAKQIGEQVARSGVPVGLITIEEGKHKVGRNLLAGPAGIDNRRLRTAQYISENDWKKIDAAVASYCGVPFYICDHVQKVGDVESAAAVMVAQYGVKMLIIDYIQLIGMPTGGSAYERTTGISMAVKALIRKLNVAGIAVTQLNRGVESREDKRPIMSDLRDSGQIEQDADQIIFVHREDYYHTDDADWQPTGIVELIIAKWKDAERGGKVELHSDLKHQRFRNISEWDGDI